MNYKVVCKWKLWVEALQEYFSALSLERRFIRCSVLEAVGYRFLESFQLNGVKMKELPVLSQQNINGGGALVYVISLIAVAVGCRVSQIVKRRFSITR